VEFDRERAHQNIQSVRPGMQILEVSSKTGQGMEQWLGFLEARRSDARPAAITVGMTD
jgi:hydrogenase nickel incorporation protein HypB